nr:immunoglobulin heavy chain junction region [Macaca mulatta]MOY21594.1 immunoglobulin heavy chain junction region [Macaca mulatta]MOY21661.1 immunoglobulin heavy chain junction region [Macaca mulatta]MOY22312.1 immunoglobulin heavy chain junction region [Macaca mulatta]MOY22929.1 immunoglobulin heavy chain junction region [Macaca mulatta]
CARGSYEDDYGYHFTFRYW